MTSRNVNNIELRRYIDRKTPKRMNMSTNAISRKTRRKNKPGKVQFKGKRKARKKTKR